MQTERKGMRLILLVHRHLEEGGEGGRVGSGVFLRTCRALGLPLLPADRDVKARESKGLSKAHPDVKYIVSSSFFYVQVPSFCSDADDIDCRLEDLTKKYCLEYNYDYENGFAIGNYVTLCGWFAKLICKLRKSFQNSSANEKNECYSCMHQVF